MGKTPLAMVLWRGPLPSRWGDVISAFIMGWPWPWLWFPSSFGISPAYFWNLSFNCSSFQSFPARPVTFSPSVRFCTGTEAVVTAIVWAHWFFISLINTEFYWTWSHSVVPLCPGGAWAIRLAHIVTRILFKVVVKLFFGVTLGNLCGALRNCSCGWVLSHCYVIGLPVYRLWVVRLHLVELGSGARVSPWVFCIGFIVFSRPQIHTLQHSFPTAKRSSYILFPGALGARRTSDRVPGGQAWYLIGIVMVCNVTIWTGLGLIEIQWSKTVLLWFHRLWYCFPAKNCCQGWACWIWWLGTCVGTGDGQVIAGSFDVCRSSSVWAHTRFPEGTTLLQFSAQIQNHSQRPTIET